MSDKEEKVIEGEVLNIMDLQKQSDDIAVQLESDERFNTLIKQQREINTKIADFWKAVEKKMINKNVKTLKGSWGSVTVAERANYKVVDVGLLPLKFTKRSADTTKISHYHQLEGKIPAGVEFSTTRYLTKRLK